jgi:hypothetical protein
VAADEPAGPHREELDDAPPFLTWRGIYFVVLAALAAEVAAGIVITLLYRP